MGANEFDQAIEDLDGLGEQPPASVPKTAAAPDNPFLQTIDAIDTSREQKLRTTTTDVQDANPEQAAEASRLSERLGIPPEIVQRNFDAIKKRAAIADTPYAQMIRETPHLSEIASDPVKAAAIKDDMEQLGALEWLFTAPQRAFAQGVNQFRYGTLRSESIFRELSQEEKDLLNAYKFGMDNGGKLGAGDSWFRGAVTTGAQNLPNLFGAALYGLKYGLAGAAEIGTIGAIGGSIIPGAGTIAGGVTGASVGFRAGMVYGGWKTTAQLEAGLAYDEYLDFTDEYGQKLDPTVARAAALATGAINGGLELIGLEKLIESIPGVKQLGRVGVKEGIKAALRVPTVRAALFEATKSYAGTLTTEAAVEVAQRAVTILSGELAKASGQGAMAPGQVERGNIDLFKQPKVTNPDGTTSTVDSVGVNVDGKELLLPTVTPDGRHLATPEEAIAEYKKTGKHLGVFETPAASTAFAQQVHEDFAAGKFESGSKFRSATSIAEDLVNEGAGALQGFALTVLPGPALHAVIGAQQARRAKQGVLFFKAIDEGVKQSKTFERLPALAQQLVERATADGPIQTVYAPIETWNTYWQSKGLDPAEVAADVTGNSTAYAKAANEGGDLAIPTARYAVKIAGTEHAGYFANELRLGPEEMNGREEAAFAQEQQAAEQAASSTSDQITPQSPIRTALMRELEGAHVPTATAERYADLYESAIGSLAERAGIDATGLYESYGLRVERPATGTLEAAAGGVQKAPGAATGAGGPAAAPGLPLETAAAPGLPAGQSERRIENVGPPAGQPDLRQIAREGTPADFRNTVGARAAELLKENPNAAREAAAQQRAYATAKAAKSTTEAPSPAASSVTDESGATAVFLAHGPSGPLYNIVGGPQDRSTVSAATLEQLGIAVPETPADTGEKLTGEQIRAKLLAARAVVDNKAAAPQTEGANAGPTDESRRADLIRDARERGVPASRPREREKPAARERRRLEHYDAVFADLVDAAKTLDPNVDEQELRAEFDFRVDALESRLQDERDSGHDAGDLLRTIAGYGGINTQERTFPGEVKFLKDGTKFGRIRGAAVFQKEGLSIDGMIEALQQDARFKWVENANVLIDAIDDAIRHPAGDDFFPGSGELWADVKLDPTARWWEDPWRPVNLTEAAAAFEGDALEHPGAGDTSFNVSEFEQSLFDEVTPPDEHADTLATGEIQPRLPGAGDVRNQEIGTPQLDTKQAAYDRANAAFKEANAAHQAITKQYRAREVSDEVFLESRRQLEAAHQAFDAAEADLPPFELRSQVAKAPKSKQTTLFQPGTLDNAGVQAWADDVKRRAGADLYRFEVYVTNGGDLHLSSLIVQRGAQRAGLGSRVMGELTRFADLNGLRVTLKPGQRDSNWGTTSRARLVEFYKRFGFAENKGRHKDFAIDADAMLREPTLPSAREDLRRTRTLDQEKRGSIRFGADRQMTIALLERADLSTFLHESGHFFLEVFTDLANQIGELTPELRTPAQQQLLADHATLSASLVDEDHTGPGFSRKQHEDFARKFEAYLFEGKAPTLELQAAFSRFRAWLIGVYRSLKNLRVELTDEVRGVMDRLVASDQAIADAEARRNIPAMFATAELAGMDPAEFELYRGTIEKASAIARENLDRKLLREVQREQTAAWKAQREEIESQVSDEVYQRPAYMAIAAMQRGEHPNGQPLVEGLETPPLKLSKAILVERYGEERLARLPKPYIYTVEGGMDPDTVAGLFGYSSGDAMLTAVEAAPPMKAVIQNETNRRQLEANGSILLDGSLHDKAQLAVANEERDAIIRAELLALGRMRRTVDPFVKAERAAGRATLEHERAERAYERRWFEAEANLSRAIAIGRKQSEIDALTRTVQDLRAKARGGAALIRAAIPPASVLRDMASRRIAALPVRDLNPNAFWSAGRRAAQQAIDRAARQDFDGAIQAKQQELININMYRAAERALEDVDERVRFARNLATLASRKRIGLAGGGYLEQIDKLLDRFGFAQAPKGSLDKAAALGNWIQGLEASGIPIELPAELLDESRRRDYQELSVEEFIGVTDGLKEIAHLAAAKNRLLKIVDRAELDAVAGGIADTIASTRGTGLQPLEFRPEDQKYRAVADWFASHNKLSTIAEWLDGGRVGGPMWEAMIRPLNAAADDEQTRKGNAGAAFAKILEAHYPGGELARLNVKLEIPAIGGSLSKEGRLAVALNWGNQTSRDRLTSDPARKWNAAQVAAILDTLDERDWRFVQATFDHINGYWAEIAAKQERVTGLAPEKVEALPIVTKFGEIAGGYYPLAYDSRLSVRAGQNEAASALKLTTAAAYVRSTTKRGHTEARKSNVRLPVRLELSVAFEHLDQVIHDLAHHETLIDVTRVLRHPKVTAAILATPHGDITYQQLSRGLQDIAIGSTPAARTVLEKSANYARQGAQIAGLGLNVWTAAQQPLGLFNGAAEIGPVWVLRGMTRWLRDAVTMENSIKWIADVSPMMRERATTGTADLHDLRAQLRRPGGWFDGLVRKVSNDAITQQTITDGFLWHIGLMQRVADVPTWLGAYEKYKSAGEKEDRAIALADQAVLNSQGGGNVKDLAQVQRGGPLARVFMTFYSYGNTVFNATALQAGRTDIRSPASVLRFIGNLSLIYFMPAVATVTLSRLLGRTGGGADDTPEGFFGDVARETVATALNTMVFVRELGGLAQEGVRGYAGPAGTRLAELLYNVGKQAKQGELDESFLRSINAAAGVLFHLPAAQIQRTIDGYIALEEGRTSNPAALLVGAPKKGAATK